MMIWTLGGWTSELAASVKHVGWLPSFVTKCTAFDLKLLVGPFRT